MAESMLNQTIQVRINWATTTWSTIYDIVKRQLDLLRDSEERMKEAYLSHNAHVINTVPADRLLIWNLKVSLKAKSRFFKD